MAYIALANLRENGYTKNFNVFNVFLCDQLLDGEMFNTLREARIAIGSCWRHYDVVSPTLSCVLLSDDARGRRARRARVTDCSPHINWPPRPLWYRDQH
jgi:hypothetical protein